MNLGALLQSFIYLVSSTLLYPTLFLESVLVLCILVFAGSFLAEWLERARLKKVPSQELAQLALSSGIEGVCPHTIQSYLKALGPLLERLDSRTETIIESLLQERISELWKSSDHLRMLIRIGPGVGLIGTLIPMSTGLAALSQGDMSKLSSELVLAFTTTVVGLAIGTSAYFLYWKKRRWIEHDVRRMEFLTEILMENRERRVSGT
ncbi:MAG: MotA/TolQ/ExbB proton channel family protein [Desulfomonile tiedjei]|uniref:MotA/TolQ/ExbB proton channel family protein n=1 Tax=Desulfomonile tiedjei TaxID=2358 RepID=A0A9D6V0X4_9BACT|nr:MotA/TolQ/ExbB proton channel family protein [Desulfomonile tiedjei]